MSTSLKELVAGLISAIDERTEFNSLDPCTKEMLDKALERVVEGTDPKIKLVPDYKRKLSKSVIKSMQYADQLIDKIPSPIHLSSREFVGNPYIRAFFPSLTGLKNACSHSDELKDYFSEDEHKLDQEGFALLCMAREEQTVLGMQLAGEQVIRDVQQKRISFFDHHLQSPADNEDKARRELKCCMFEGLVNNALDTISELRTKRQQLETKQRVLLARLREHQTNGSEQSESMGGIAEDGLEIRNEQIELEQTEQALHEIGYITPDVSLGRVKEIMDHPEDFVQMKQYMINIDKSGVMHPETDQSPSVHQLALSEVNIKGHPPRVVTLARVDRGDIMPGVPGGQSQYRLF